VSSQLIRIIERRSDDGADRCRSIVTDDTVVSYTNIIRRRGPRKLDCLSNQVTRRCKSGWRRWRRWRVKELPTIFYTGLGWLVPILFIAPFIVIGVFLNKLTGFDVLDRSVSSLPLHLLILMGALLTFVVGLFVNRKKIAEVTFEKSGSVTTYRTRHTLYAIPMQYWGLIGLAIYFGFTAYRSFR